MEAPELLKGFNSIHLMQVCRLGGSLKIKMADSGIQGSTFIVKHNGSIDFSINEKISVQEPGKVSVFSRQDFDSIKPKSRKFTFLKALFNKLIS